MGTVANAERPATLWSSATGDFSDFGNWSLGTPGSSLDARIDNGGTARISSASQESVAYVYLGSRQNTSGTLEISSGGVANFTTMIVGALNAAGTLKISAGGRLTTFGGPIGSDYLGIGKATVDGAGSSWKVTGSEMVIGGNGTGTLTLQNNGSFNVGNGTGRIQLGNHPVSEGTLMIGSGGAAGTLSASEIYNGEGRATVIFNHNNSAYVFAPKLSGLKTLNGFLNVRQDGPGTTILTAQNSLAGTTVVSAGTLLVNGAILGNLADVVMDDMIVGQEKSVGEVSVLANGTLGGIGLIEGKTTVFGTLAPGVAVGVLKFGGELDLASTGTVTMELGGRVRGASFDGVDVAGSLIYGGTLRITLLNGFVPNDHEAFDLFDGFSASSGTFASIIFSSGSYAGAFDAQTGILSVSTVPEPGVGGMVAIGMAALAVRRRNRVKH